MDNQNILLDIISSNAIFSAILVIQSKNPVNRVLFLISVFLHVCGYLVLLGLGFIGISYVIVYVGAIAILFLFVVIILNLELQELSVLGKEYTKNLVIAQFLGCIFLFETVSVVKNSIPNYEDFINNSFTNININFRQIEKFEITNVNSVLNETNFLGNFQNFIDVQSIAIVLYRNCIIWLIICSIILVLAIVCPITLRINSKKTEIRLIRKKI